MMKWISNIAAVLWFFAILVWMLLLLPLCIIMIPSMDINVILRSGFGTNIVGFMMIFLIGLVFGITMLIPAFRKCFKVLPWLYTYIMVLSADVIILSIAEEILNYGFRVQNNTRHTVFKIIMFLQIIVCRLAMCWYFHKKPMKIAREDYE